MQVILLAHTPNPDELVAAAARICYRDIAASELLQCEGENLSRKLIADLFRSGHTSTFEHVSFTFGIDGLSRVASHQLVRHRLASFSQQSQRYVKMTPAPDSVVVPPAIQSNPEALKLFRESVIHSQDTYRQLIEMGIPKEDARFILPHGHSTRLVLTMNARELLHFLALRCCRRAQWEIREVAWQMLELVYPVAPSIFSKAGPGCVSKGCPEGRFTCGDPSWAREKLAGIKAKTDKTE